MFRNLKRSVKDNRSKNSMYMYVFMYMFLNKFV